MHDPNSRLTDDISTHYSDQLETVQRHDLAMIREKDTNYGGSWLKRGGVGVFFNFARKWDRLEKQAEAHGYDVIRAAEADGREEGLLDDIGDLRRYLTLLEAELIARKTRGEHDHDAGNDRL